MQISGIKSAVLALFIAGAAAAEPLGDVAEGEKVFRKCASCHQLGPTAQNRTGPHLNDLFGRAAGHVPDYTYSASLLRAGVEGLFWTRETLDAYIENPKALVSGTRMRFNGIKDPVDRAHLLAYLRAFSASPANIPEAAPTALPTDHDLDPAILALQGDPEYGEYLSSECTTCHQTDGGDAGIPSIVGWMEEDFVIAMHAYKNKLRPHPVMQMTAGRLSDDEIAALAAYFKALDQ